VYNSNYIGAADGLVPFYPALEDEGGNTYRRHMLDAYV
jgi:splicing factor 3B subunit 1